MGNCCIDNKAYSDTEEGNSRKSLEKLNQPKAESEAEEGRFSLASTVILDSTPIDRNLIINQQSGLPLDNYILEKELGSGSYGDVYKVRHKELNVLRAMKKIKNSSCLDEKSKKEIINEIELLKSIDHPNIIKIFEYYITSEGIFIITEYCSGGELFDKIISMKKLTELQSAYIIYQLLSSIFYCHNLNIIHRDLKPENILIESEEKENGLYNIKVIDFGTAKIFNLSKLESQVIGSGYYIAPEVLNSKYNEKCDIWSVGVILYILLSGVPPFNGKTDDDIIQNIKKGVYDLKSSKWEEISSEAKNLIKQMLDMNVLSRISAQKALCHGWFVKYSIKEKFVCEGQEKLKKSIENIKQYKSNNKLQQAALAFILHNSLHLPEVKDLIRIFKSIDLDGNGKISKMEMENALSKFYNVPNVNNEIDLIFSNVDNDNNGYIDYEEYIRASISKDKLLDNKNLKYVFKFFDKDGNGFISLNEIETVLFNQFPSETRKVLSAKLMKEIDDDHNNQINFDEFERLMRKLVV